VTGSSVRSPVRRTSSIVEPTSRAISDPTVNSLTLVPRHRPGSTGRSSTPRHIGSSTAVSGILDAPLSRGMTAESTVTISRTNHRVLAAHSPSCAIFTCPHKIRGRRECRVKASPMARLQKSKQAAVTTGSAESSGIPCAMVLTLIARSPWEPGFLAPIAREIIISRTWPQRREARTTRLRRPHRRRSSGDAGTSIAARTQRP
jgi:hypothetical protein